MQRSKCTLQSRLGASKIMRFVVYRSVHFCTVVSFSVCQCNGCEIYCFIVRCVVEALVDLRRWGVGRVALLHEALLHELRCWVALSWGICCRVAAFVVELRCCTRLWSSCCICCRGVSVCDNKQTYVCFLQPFQIDKLVSVFIPLQFGGLLTCSFFHGCVIFLCLQFTCSLYMFTFQFTCFGALSWPGSVVGVGRGVEASERVVGTAAS